MPNLKMVLRSAALCLLLSAVSLARADERIGREASGGSTLKARSTETAGTTTSSASRTFARFLEDRLQLRLIRLLFDLSGSEVPPAFLPDVVSDDPDPTGIKGGGNHSSDRQERENNDPDVSNTESEQAARGMSQGGS